MLYSYNMYCFYVWPFSLTGSWLATSWGRFCEIWLIIITFGSNGSIWAADGWEYIFCVCQKLNDDVNRSEKLFSFWRLFDTLTKQWKMGKMRHWIQMQFLMHLENLVILELNTFDMLRISFSPCWVSYSRYKSTVFAMGKFTPLKYYINRVSLSQNYEP